MFRKLYIILSLFKIINFVFEFVLAGKDRGDLFSELIVCRMYPENSLLIIKVSLVIHIFYKHYNRL